VSLGLSEARKARANVPFAIFEDSTAMWPTNSGLIDNESPVILRHDRSGLMMSSEDDNDNNDNDDNDVEIIDAETVSPREGDTKVDKSLQEVESSALWPTISDRLGLDSPMIPPCASPLYSSTSSKGVSDWLFDSYIIVLNSSSCLLASS
jgi:hypothetical protein